MAQSHQQRNQMCAQGVLLLVCLIMSLAGTTRAFAETRIGFVDIPYLIDKAPQALEAESRLEMEFAPRQSELQMQRDELAEITARLDAATELSENENDQLERQARAMERRLKRDERDFREELSIQKNNEFKKVRILVLEAIGQFGKTNDYDLIVSDGVLYANKSIDVTLEILDYLVKSSQAIQSSN
ncbi:MAG: OmpH family outer membrane protein [Granulosicoccus sp.]|nr:OmpH family outer membrane protein [Granulosicoccus sp.]